MPVSNRIIIPDSTNERTASQIQLGCFSPWEHCLVQLLICWLATGERYLHSAYPAGHTQIYPQFCLYFTSHTRLTPTTSLKSLPLKPCTRDQRTQHTAQKSLSWHRREQRPAPDAVYEWQTWQLTKSNDKKLVLSMIELVTASCVRVRGSVWGYGIEHARAGGAARKAGTKGRRLLVYGGTRSCSRPDFAPWPSTRSRTAFHQTVTPIDSCVFLHPPVTIRQKMRPIFLFQADHNNRGWESRQGQHGEAATSRRLRIAEFWIQWGLQATRWRHIWMSITVWAIFEYFIFHLFFHSRTSSTQVCSLTLTIPLSFVTQMHMFFLS